MMFQVLDHLWQSTLAALAAILLARALPKAPAGVRYGLWFAASVKFLVPFAALAALGRLLAPAGLFPARAAPEAAMIERVTRPLSQFPLVHDAALDTALPPAPIPPAATPVAHGALHLDIGLIFLAVWAFGCGAVVMTWAVRWARVRRVVRSAQPLAWPAPMPVLASPSLMEPGLVGLLRPVLVVPETLPERLTRSEIDAILAHEIGHLRRRDNLTAAVHMLIEALFWFHPLVWWIGARLIEERERACDEAVIEAGHDRRAYARCLVESSRLYLQSPLSCVAGASGSNLKSRVEMIMTAPLASPLSPFKKALLLAAGACAVAAPVMAGLTATPEGQKAVARAVAATSGALGALAAGATPNSDANKPIILARHETLLAPARAVARLDAAPAALVRDVAALGADLGPPQIEAPPSQTAPPAPDASAVPTPPLTKIALETTRSQVEKQAYDFVRSYAQSSLDPIGISRWGDPLCIQVAGLAPSQGALVRARIAQVARMAGVSALEPGCRIANVQIVFTTEPQRVLDHEAARRGWDVTAARRNGWLLSPDAASAKSDAQPVQVWYRAIVADDRGADVDASPTAFDDCNSRIGCPLKDTFQFILVVVDLGRVQDRRPAALADYAAMAALSQPRSLGRCNVLPSVTDLFAGACPGRRPPTGLTAADAAYLTALYASNPEAKAVYRQQIDIAERMADTLVKATAATGGQTPPG